MERTYASPILSSLDDLGITGVIVNNGKGNSHLYAKYTRILLVFPLRRVAVFTETVRTILCPQVWVFTSHNSFLLGEYFVFYEILTLYRGRGRKNELSNNNIMGSNSYW